MVLILAVWTRHAGFNDFLRFYFVPYLVRISSPAKRFPTDRPLYSSQIIGS